MESDGFQRHLPVHLHIAALAVLEALGSYRAVRNEFVWKHSYTLSQIIFF